MIKIGQYNDLAVSRLVDFGAYLTDDAHTAEVLLPARYIDTPLRSGDPLRVFVYRDSEDRPVATTERPFATVGQLAWLQVTAVNEVGAFLDWGLEKDLLVPFREQKTRMRRGMQYLVYVYLDDASGRVVASAKIEKFIDNTIPRYKPFQRVSAMVTGHTEIGYRAVVENLHSAMIYENQVYRQLEVGEPVTAYVRKIREDGKLDLTLLPPAAERIGELARRILDRLEKGGGHLDIGDHTSPEYIGASFECSKKDFKKAIGHLLKEQKIVKTERGISLFSAKRR
ncbi:MAG: S1-like domain-containing RNA-binding protein [Clostridium sp.]|nr:S1-like domain-containing RNA-binding protein [Clostridium sp.]